jgi:hypothetical protein
VGCLAVQYLGYERVLAAGLRNADEAGKRRAIKRWLAFAAAWQLIVLAGVVAYALVIGRGGRGAGLAWIAPPVAALLGTALPLQLAAARLARAWRP